jgi:hypothetical protein
MRSTYTHAQRAGIPNTRVTTPHDHELRFSYCSECPKADLKTGAHVFIPRWEKQGDGTWQATVVVVGRDGITPPM